MFNLPAHPKVSVIMPVYNREVLISESIESVTQQTYTNWELIIIDDGSDDGTESVVKEKKDERIRFIQNERIGIVGRLKNLAMQNATGVLIAFLDSDDLWARDKLEKQVISLQENKEAAFCLTNGYNFTIQSHPLDYFYNQKAGTRTGNLFLPLFRSEIAAYTQSLLFHVNCLKISGKFKEDGSFSDVDFISRLAYHFKGIVLYEPLFFRRYHNSNYINDNTWEKSFYEGIQIIKQNKSMLPPLIFKDALFSTYIRFGEKNISHHKTVRAIDKFMKAWQCKPFSIIPAKKIMKAVYYQLRNWKQE